MIIHKILTLAVKTKFTEIWFLEYRHCLLINGKQLWLKSTLNKDTHLVELALLEELPARCQDPGRRAVEAVLYGQHLLEVLMLAHVLVDVHGDLSNLLRCLWESTVTYIAFMLYYHKTANPKIRHMYPAPPPQRLRTFDFLCPKCYFFSIFSSLTINFKHNFNRNMAKTRWKMTFNSTFNTFND